MAGVMDTISGLGASRPQQRPGPAQNQNPQAAALAAALAQQPGQAPAAGQPDPVSNQQQALAAQMAQMKADEKKNAADSEALTAAQAQPVPQGPTNAQRGAASTPVSARPPVGPTAAYFGNPQQGR